MPVRFEDYDAVLLDLDGTLCKHNEPLPAAVETIDRLRRVQPRYAILSNSTGSPARVAERMRQMGLPADAAHVTTAAAAACDLVCQQHAAAGRRPRVFNLCTRDVYEMLDGRADFAETAADACDAVIVGTPNNEFATADRQTAALALLRGGAALVGSSADRVYPSPRGIEFGAGALTSLLAYAADVRPTFCGKPQKSFFADLCRRLGARPERSVLVGDNLESDIAGAKSVGMSTVLVLTGVTRAAEVAGLAGQAQPDLVAADLREVLGSD